MTNIPTMRARLYEALFEPDELSRRDANELHLDVTELLDELEQLRRERDAARHDERVAVVTWLRDLQVNWSPRVCAHGIEQGEHLMGVKA